MNRPFSFGAGISASVAAFVAAAGRSSDLFLGGLSHLDHLDLEVQVLAAQGVVHVDGDGVVLAQEYLEGIDSNLLKPYLHSHSRYGNNCRNCPDLYSLFD